MGDGYHVELVKTFFHYKLNCCRLRCPRNCLGQFLLSPSGLLPARLSSAPSSTPLPFHIFLQTSLPAFGEAGHIRMSHAYQTSAYPPHQPYAGQPMSGWGMPGYPLQQTPSYGSTDGSGYGLPQYGPGQVPVAQASASFQHGSPSWPQPGKPQSSQACYNCGAQDHWAQHCREPRRANPALVRCRETRDRSWLTLEQWFVRPVPRRSSPQSKQ